jgi:GTP 3',8-cyclase
MIDGFQRQISYLRVSVTDLCNLRCRYCMPECGVDKKDHRQILSIEEITEIVEAAASLGVKKVRITGGEPLVRKGILSLCQQISAIDGIEEVAMTSNGLLLKEMAEPLAKAGLQRINISLDTLKADKFQQMARSGSLEEVLSGIEAAKEAGLTPIKINTVLIGGFNEDEIADLAQLTMEEELEVRFIELMPLGPAANFQDGSFLPCEKVLQVLPELKACGNSGVAKLYQLPGAKGKIGLITPISHDFCDSCDKIRLTSDGKIKPCLHSDSEILIRGYHGEELVQKLAEAIGQKPQQHPEFLEGQASASGRSMNQIGG